MDEERSIKNVLDSIKDANLALRDALAALEGVEPSGDEIKTIEETVAAIHTELSDLLREAKKRNP